MSRPLCRRRIAGPPEVAVFKPAGIPMRSLDQSVLTYDEFEALRLADRQGLYQDEAAQRMGISRPTFSRIIAEARRKIATALVDGMALKIEGGVIEMASKRTFQCDACENRWQLPFGSGRPEGCPECGAKAIHREWTAEEAGQRGAGRGRGQICARRSETARTSKGED